MTNSDPPGALALNQITHGKRIIPTVQSASPSNVYVNGYAAHGRATENSMYATHVLTDSGKIRVRISD
jgi:hypothetical protein